MPKMPLPDSTMTLAPLPMRLGLFLIPLSLVACGPNQDQPMVHAESPQADGLAKVVTLAVAARDLTSTITVPGSVQAIQSADLYARVSGYLAEISVDLGDTVAQGQTLARISVPAMDAELTEAAAAIGAARSRVAQQAAAVVSAAAGANAAEANKRALESGTAEKSAMVNLAQSELDRWTLLTTQSSAIEPKKVDEARLRLAAAQAGLAGMESALAAGDALIAQARAMVEQAKADEQTAQAEVQVAEAAHAALAERVQYATIRAPFAGVITQRHFHPGALIQSADKSSGTKPLLRLERTDFVRITIDVPMDAVATLNKGDTVHYTEIATAPGKSFVGVITRTSGALGQRSRMMRAEIELANPATSNGERALQPGAYGNLTVLLEQFPACPSVPASAVFNRNGQLSVFVAENNTLRLTPISPIYQDGTTVGVSAGLSPGQEVVASGFSELKHGQKVRATKGGVR